MPGLLLEEIEEICVARQEPKHDSSSPGLAPMSTPRPSFDTEWARWQDAAVPDDEAAVRPRLRCPRCGKETVWVENPHRPFCGLTCRLIDLGGWLDERYRVGGESLPDDQPPRLRE